MSCNPFSPICLRKPGEGMLLFIEKNDLIFLACDNPMKPPLIVFCLPNTSLGKETGGKTAMIHFLAKIFRGCLRITLVLTLVAVAVLGYRSGVDNAAQIGWPAPVCGVVSMLVSLLVGILVNGVVFGMAANIIEIHDAVCKKN